MQKVFDEVVSLDKKCYEEFLLSEDILMEHAANTLADVIRKQADKNETIFFLCGPGNNGGDGLATARILHKEYNVLVYIPYGVKSKMARLQLKRYEAIDGIIEEKVCEADLYVDALFGSGLSKKLDKKSSKILDEINQKDAKKISCDIPSGIGSEFVCDKVFRADISVSMGALKLSFFEDSAKDFIGEIEVANLGVAREVYENSSNVYLLEKSDMRLPLRERKNSNKRNFGHTCVVMGDKEGAAILAAVSAFNFGSGLVSVMTNKSNNIPPYIMTTTDIPKNATALVVGMGLGNTMLDTNLMAKFNKPIVVDADLFYKPNIAELLVTKQNIVLTPHPKEFASLLNLCHIASIDAIEIQKSRFKWVRIFMKHFPHVTLVLKGANTLIANGTEIYICTLGTNALSKGGSGDVLAGMIASLLAQGYDTKDASTIAVLAHAIAGREVMCNNYALNPLDICEGIKCL